MSDIFEKIIEIRERGIPAALCTVTAVKGSSPGKESFKMLVCQNGELIGTVGGGALENIVIEKAKEIIKSEKAHEFTFDLSEEGSHATGMLCSGIINVFIEPIVRHYAYIFGGGHVGLHLDKILTMVGFTTIIVDDREEFSNKIRFPQALECLAGEYTEVMPTISLKQPAYVVITTRGHSYDKDVLEWALQQETSYIGMIGSKSKIATTFSRLKEKGFSQEALNKVHSPIGLDIGAVSAEEIAVSIAAELIQAKRKP